MALMPGAVWRPIPCNFSAGPITHQAFVVHVTQGFGSLFEYLSNPAAQVSSHFWVALDGTVEQYVDTENAAWAEEAGNFSNVSAETEGFGVAENANAATYLTDAQVAGLANIYAWLHNEHGIPLQTCDHGGDGITTHCFYPSGLPDPNWGDHPCPGIRLTQIPAVLAATVALLNPVVPPPVEDDVKSVPFVTSTGPQGNAYVSVKIPAGTTTLVAASIRVKRYGQNPVGNAPDLTATGGATGVNAQPCESPDPTLPGTACVRISGGAPHREYSGTALFL